MTRTRHGVDRGPPYGGWERGEPQPHYWEQEQEVRVSSGL